MGRAEHQAAILLSVAVNPLRPRYMGLLPDPALLGRCLWAIRGVECGAWWAGSLSGILSDGPEISRSRDSVLCECDCGHPQGCWLNAGICNPMGLFCALRPSTISATVGVLQERCECPTKIHSSNLPHPLPRTENRLRPTRLERSMRRTYRVDKATNRLGVTEPLMHAVRALSHTASLSSSVSQFWHAHGSHGGLV
jgi:hypothetical protein